MIFISLLCVTGLTLSAADAQYPKPVGKTDFTRKAFRAAMRQAGVLPEPAVDPGSESRAIEYYKAIATDLGFSNPEQVMEEHDLQQLLAYCGYARLRARDIERLPSGDLMDFSRLRANVSNPAEFAAHFGAEPGADDGIRHLLSSRFFSPKITDVSGLVPRNFGWRRVVRLTPRDGSAAAQKKIDALYLLFNHFEPDPQKDPFAEGNQSVNNQAMLIRNAPADGQRPAYWFVYEPLNGARPGKIKTYLDASFDAIDTSRLPAGAIKPYYVPNACAQCHGGRQRDPQMIFKTARLNYLDTDHWFDRIESDNDFPGLQQSVSGVLLDGKKDPNSAEFKSAFNVVRKLNQEMLEQNRVVEANEDAFRKPSFQLRAVEKWMAIHATDATHQSLVSRALPPQAAGGPVWSSSAEDQKLLGLLNRYCYRCHSSINYNVFEKQAVARRKAGIIGLLQSGSMPQDRLLSDEEIEKITALVGALEGGG